MGSLKGQLLWENIRQGDLSAVVNLLESGGINLEERDDNGQTFLMHACDRGELSIVRELLEVDVDVNAVDNDNWSALLCASKEGHLDIVIEVLEKGASLEHRDLCGWTPLMWACYRGKQMVVQELLDRSANPNIKAEHNMTCLIWSAGRGYTEILLMLLHKGAKVNIPDKYGTTPLIWAARKGSVDICAALLKEGSNVDATGMNSWNALIAATRGGFTELVQIVIEYSPNLNAVDKDGFTALAIAAKEGFVEIAQNLLAKGAYVNVSDKEGDTVLIHAVKAGHIEVVHALLSKYADVDQQNAEGKTALYWAVEKGHNSIVKLLLNNDADAEIITKDNDTALLRAVKTRSEECVKLLMEKGAKVSVTDKRGDNPLHISLRARSKRITELLLRNPRNSRLLYRPNSAGDTPYSIDTHYQRGILTQIFGHRNLNANDGENLLGYEIYSSALADILSEPSLNTPITVGLYAKWGSGKSFLLGKLKSEMRSFTQHTVDNQLSFTFVLFLLCFLFNLLIGFPLALAIETWQIGVGIGFGLFVVEYAFFTFIYVATNRYELQFAISLSQLIAAKLDILKLLLQLLFCNSRRHKTQDIPVVRFLFSEYTRITSVGGEKSLAAMLGTLCDAVESEYGSLVTRLYRVFKPHQESAFSPGRFKSLCCVPYFIWVIFVVTCALVGISLLVVYKISDNPTVNAILITMACITGLAVIGNLYTWGQAAVALVISQKRRILQAADHIESLKMDGFMQKVKQEVDLVGEFVTHMDTFTDLDTRLVIVVDGLDSCEQDKILQVLDTVNVLFSDADSPFVTILAVDPHVIIRGIEQNLRLQYHDSNINGYDYLRNIVHLPFYLQSQGVRVQRQDTVVDQRPDEQGSSNPNESPRKYRSPPQHQESVLTSNLSLADIKHKTSMSIRSAGGIGKKGSTHAQFHTSNFDLSKALVKNDYFSDINPRSMRRLMNIVAVTGRLLRAYNIEFSWQRLAAWINIIEQWPYRVSWVILFWEEQSTQAEGMSLRDIYDKIADQIPVSRDVEPLLEIDRNVRKFEGFLSNHSASSPVLSVMDLKKFLPCTINLDPYLRKLIRELQHNAEAIRPDLPFNIIGMPPTAPPSATPSGPGSQRGVPKVAPAPVFNPNAVGASPARFSSLGMVSHSATMGMQPNYGFGGGLPPHMYSPYAPYMMSPYQMAAMGVPMMPPGPQAPTQGTAAARLIMQDYHGDERLSQMSVDRVCNLLTKITGMSKNLIPRYDESIRENNVNGLVLVNCEIDELKKVMGMAFGDWQLFRTMVQTFRESEAALDLNYHETDLDNIGPHSTNNDALPKNGSTDVNNDQNDDLQQKSPEESRRRVSISQKPPEVLRSHSTISEDGGSEAEESIQVTDGGSKHGQLDRQFSAGSESGMLRMNSQFASPSVNHAAGMESRFSGASVSAMRGAHFSGTSLSHVSSTPRMNNKGYKMNRKDSILEQLAYENAILQEAMEEFADPSDDEVDDQVHVDIGDDESDDGEEMPKLKQQNNTHFYLEKEESFDFHPLDRPRAPLLLDRSTTVTSEDSTSFQTNNSASSRSESEQRSTSTPEKHIKPLSLKLSNVVSNQETDVETEDSHLLPKSISAHNISETLPSHPLAQSHTHADADKKMISSQSTSLRSLQESIQQYLLGSTGSVGGGRSSAGGAGSVSSTSSHISPFAVDQTTHAIVHHGGSDSVMELEPFKNASHWKANGASLKDKEAYV